MADKTRVLVVDDDADFCDGMSDILEAKGYEVESENSGPAAIARVKKKSFHVVLMDIRMPVMNGVQALKQIKKISPTTVVIMMTAFSLDDSIREALQKGAFGCLHKPLDIDKVVEQIELAKGKGLLILVTDDDRGIRQTFKDVLEAKGYRVSIAGSGEEAICITKKRPHDILFIDMKLPTLNGLEVYLTVKGINPKAIAVIMTAYWEGMKNLVEEALEKGAYACLRKPFDMDEVLGLLEEIAKSIKRRGGERQRTKSSIKKERLAIPKTILMVDDNENARTSLADILEEEGYRVIEAADGKEGVAKALREKPDLVLVDTIMSGMDGHKVCRKIKKVRDLPIKIIVYTAIIDAVDAVKARRMGADDYVVRTSDPSHLLDAIKKLI